MSSRSMRTSIARGVVVAGLSLSLALLPLAGCSSSGSSGTSSESTAATTDSSSESATSTAVSTSGDAVQVLDDTDVFTDRDLDSTYDASDATTITLSDSGSTATGSGVSIEGSTVTISAAGTYVVSGSLSDGQIVVNVADTAKVQIVLDGASVSCSSSAALYVINADKVFLTLADGTSNSLATTGSFVETDDNKVDGALFAKDDLTVNGNGSLDVTCSEGHGIVCKNDLRLVSGSVTVNAAKHAVQAKDSIAVCGGTWNLTGGTDGLHCANDEDNSKGWIYVSGGTLDITAASDGFDASNDLEIDGGDITVSAGDDGIHSEYELAINGGTIDVETAYEGIEGSKIYVTSGSINVYSTDDALNAAGDPSTTTSSSAGGMGGGMGGGGMGSDDSAYLLISGGTLTIDAPGGDGVDSNGGFDMTGGTVFISGPTNGGNGSIDYGEGSSASITGGTIMCAGASGMQETFGTDSTQGSALVSLSGSAGDVITVSDDSGAALGSFTCKEDYDVVVVSCEGMVSGGTYTITAGSNSTTITLDSVVYSDGGSGSGMGGMGGQMQTQGNGGMGQTQGGPGSRGGSAPNSSSNSSSTTA